MFTTSIYTYMHISMYLHMYIFIYIIYLPQKKKFVSTNLQFTRKEIVSNDIHDISVHIYTQIIDLINIKKHVLFSISKDNDDKCNKKGIQIFLHTNQYDSAKNEKKKTTNSMNT
jgi:hypothetical protein